MQFHYSKAATGFYMAGLCAKLFVNGRLVSQQYSLSSSDTICKANNFHVRSVRLTLWLPKYIWTLKKKQNKKKENRKGPVIKTVKRKILHATEGTSFFPHQCRWHKFCVTFLRFYLLKVTNYFRSEILCWLKILHFCLCF